MLSRRFPRLVPILLSLATISTTVQSRSPPSPASMTTTTTESDSSRLVTDPLPELPLLPISSPETIRACRAMPITSRDVFVCSYPKSGTTWTQNVVVRLLWELANNSNDKEHPLPGDWHLSHSAPFYEVDQYWRDYGKNAEDGTPGHETEPPIMARIPAHTPILGNDDGREYRVFNTHLLPHQLPKGARCVYVLRDPLDVMVSFYHHLSNQAVEDGGYTKGLDDFFKEFLDGTIVYGKWQDHIEAWLGRSSSSHDASESSSEKDVLILHYEDMKEDLSRETKRLARFLAGDDRDTGLDDLVAQVVPHCTFAAMKEARRRYTPKTVGWRIDPSTQKPYDAFVRKGAVGDGKRYLETSTTLSGALRERWTGTDALLARARWARAGVDPELIDRYLPVDNHTV